MWMSHVFQEMLHHNLALVNGHLECSWSICRRDGGCGIHDQGEVQKMQFNQQVRSLTSGTATPSLNEGMISTPCLVTLIMKTGSIFYIKFGVGGNIFETLPQQQFSKKLSGKRFVSFH